MPRPSSTNGAAAGHSRQRGAQGGRRATERRAITGGRAMTGSRKWRNDHPETAMADPGPVSGAAGAHGDAVELSGGRFAIAVRPMERNLGGQSVATGHTIPPGAVPPNTRARIARPPNRHSTVRRLGRPRRRRERSERASALEVRECVTARAFPGHGKVLVFGSGLAQCVSAPSGGQRRKCPRSRDERAGRGLIGAWL
jgi:hypothetical protein